MPTKTDARAQVAILNKVAKTYGVPKIDRDAPLVELKKFWQKLIKVAHPDKGGRNEDVFTLTEVQKFFNNFVDGRSPSQAEEAAEAGSALAVCPKTEAETMGVMLTFNGSQGVMARNHDDIAAEFREWVESLSTKIGFKRYSATCEQSMRANRVVSLDDVFNDVDYFLPDGSPVRDHLHLFIEFSETRSIVVEEFAAQCEFSGMVPQVSVNQGRGVSQRKSLDRCHFYVRAEKIGSIFFFGTYLPWTEWVAGAVANYTPQGRWVDDLWSQHKLANPVYLKYAELVRVGLPGRKTAHDLLVNTLLRRRMNEEAARRQELLDRGFGPSRTIAAIEKWKATYNTLSSRYFILVLRAGSRSGKTEAAKSLFENVWEQVIEDLAAPNLRSFDRSVHSAILLDNVNSAQFILDNRGLLMARNTVHELSQTTTGLFTYPCYIHRIPVIITMDVEQPWPNSNWLSENCIVVQLAPGEKFYEGSAGRDTAPPSSHTAAQASCPRLVQMPSVTSGLAPAAAQVPLPQNRLPLSTPRGSIPRAPCPSPACAWLALREYCRISGTNVRYEYMGDRHGGWTCVIKVNGQDFRSSQQVSQKMARKSAAAEAFARVCC